MAHLSHFDALFLLAPLPRAERREQGRTEEALALQERARRLFTQVHKLADSTSGPDIPPGAGSQEN